MKKGKTLVLSLGGSIIVPDGIDIPFLKKFRNAILGFVKKGNRAIIVCGGGGLNRQYNATAKSIAKISDTDLDWLGVAATKTNAELVRAIFGKLAYEKVVSDPTAGIKTNRKIIIASGWKPGWSTDYDAVLLAANFHAKKLLNFTDVDYVYDRDPRKFRNARKLERLSWREYLSIVGKTWKPRLHLPFDPVAAQLAMKKGISVIILNGTNIGNIRKVLQGKKAKGTVIS
jgi:uridylate kinase